LSPELELAGATVVGAAAVVAGAVVGGAVVGGAVVVVLGSVVGAVVGAVVGVVVVCATAMAAGPRDVTTTAARTSRPGYARSVRVRPLRCVGCRSARTET
jgi:hypothetical protein